MKKTILRILSAVLVVVLLAVGVTLFLMAGWLGGELLRYSADIFNRFYLL